MASHPSLIVIGGGISGLSLAHFATRSDGREVVVLEERDEPGGCLRTERLSSGFWFELGAHTCYAGYQTFLDLVTQTVGLERLQARRRAPYRLLVDGEIKKITSELRWVELLLSARRAFTSKKAGKSVADFYGPIVGERNYAHVFAPLFSAVPSQEAGGFPADTLFKKRIRRKGVLRSFTLKGGLGTFANALAARPGLRVVTGMRATRVEVEGQEFVVATSQGTTFRAPRLAIAVPPPIASSLLARAFPEVASIVGEIRAAKVTTTGVVVKSKGLRLPRVAGIVPLADSFFSAVSRDIVPDPRYRAFTFHFRPGIGEKGRRERIMTVLGITSAALEHVAHNEALVPALALGHANIVTRIDRALAKRPLAITGNYLHGLAIEDCVSRSQSESRRLSALGD